MNVNEHTISRLNDDMVRQGHIGKFCPKCGQDPIVSNKCGLPAEYSTCPFAVKLPKEDPSVTRP